MAAYADTAPLTGPFNLTPSAAKAGGYTRATDSIGVLAPDAGSARSTALHELQQAVQNREGFAAGGNPKDPSLQAYFDKGREAYMRLAGEVEARNVQKRRN